MSHEAGPKAGSKQATSTAATLFDLRTVIALLFGVYGIGLTALGLFSNEPGDLEKSGGLDLNLWTGIGMLVLSALFFTWVLLRPPVVAAPAKD